MSEPSDIAKAAAKRFLAKQDFSRARSSFRAHDLATAIQRAIDAATAEAKAEAKEWKLTAEQESRNRAGMVGSAKDIAYLEAKAEFKAELAEAKVQLREAQDAAANAPDEVWEKLRQEGVDFYETDEHGDAEEDARCVVYREDYGDPSVGLASSCWWETTDGAFCKLKADLTQAQAIIDKVSKTADGKPFSQGMTVYHVGACGDMHVATVPALRLICPHPGCVDDIDWETATGWYSTPEGAAEAAKDTT